VNILESFEVVKRLSKNVYSLQDPMLIKKRIQALEAGNAGFSQAAFSQPVPSQSSLYLIESEMSQNLISIKTKRHKSLGVLTLIFIKLFIQKGPILSLDEAAELMIEDEAHSLFKSKVSFMQFDNCRAGGCTTSRMCLNPWV